MNKTFMQNKTDVENKIHKLLMKFKKETNISISFVDFKEEKNVGFNNLEKYNTNIVIKN